MSLSPESKDSGHKLATEAAVIILRIDDNCCKSFRQE
jgi:hypothetical protein